MSLSCMSIGTCLCLKCVLGVAEGVGGLMEMGDTFPHSQPVLRAATSMNSPLTYPPLSPTASAAVEPCTQASLSW